MREEEKGQYCPLGSGSLGLTLRLETLLRGWWEWQQRRERLRALFGWGELEMIKIQMEDIKNVSFVFRWEPWGTEVNMDIVVRTLKLARTGCEKLIVCISSHVGSLRWVVVGEMHHAN